MRSRSAAFELALLAVLVMAVVLGVVTWLSIRWERTGLLDEVKRGLSLTSDTLHSSLRQGMMKNQREEILGTIERVARDTRIKRIRLIEHRGRVSVSTRDGDLDRRVDRNAQACAMCHAGEVKADSRKALSPAARAVQEGNTMRGFTPVLVEPGCVTSACHQDEAQSGVLGVIDISLSLDEVEEALTRSQMQLGGLSVAAILLGGALLWFGLARRFRRPMRDVLRGIRRIADGELDHRIPARTRDEFGELADSFNTMSQQLTTVQQGLIQSERLISMGKLAAGVAHEINNPLTGILSYGEDLLEDSTPSDPHRKDYEVIVREAMRCRRIVRNLLDFARQDTLSLDRVRPRELLERALDVFARQAVFRNIRFRRLIEENLPTIKVDPVQIQQVLVNLIINAQQAMPDGGTVDLAVRCVNDGRQVEFLLQDEGPGISPEVQPHIFEPFFSTKGGKTDGLGLAVCLGIIRQHGGSIDLKSEPGVGTTFRVLLPVDSRGNKHEREGVSDGQAHSGG